MDSEWWNDYRRLFPVTSKYTFLDHAAVAPLSAPAAQAIARFAEEYSQFSGRWERSWAATTEETRAKLAALLNASPQEIAFVKNTTEGINIVANGIDWRPGDKIVTANLEFPANVYPWWNLARLGVETVMVPARDGRIPPEDLLGAVDARTRLVTISLVEFSNGFRNDVDSIGAFCRQRGIYFLVDAIQALGALRVDVRQSNIDFLASGAHKWLLGPIGIGCFYCREELLDRIWPSYVGHNSMLPTKDHLDYDFKLRPTAQRFEISGQNYAGIYGLNANLDLIAQVGIDRIEKRVLELTDMLVYGLQSFPRKDGYQVTSSLAPGERSGIIAFVSPPLVGYASPLIYRQLQQHKIIASLRAGAIRVSPHFYNNKDDIDCLLEALPFPGRALPRRVSST